MTEETAGVDIVTAETTGETPAKIEADTEMTLGGETEAETEDISLAETDHNQEEGTTGSHPLVRSVNKKDTPMMNVRLSRKLPK